MDQQNKQGFDKNIIWVTVFVIGVWFLWSKHLQTKYPDFYDKEKQNTAAAVKDTSAENQAKSDTSVGTASKGAVKPVDFRKNTESKVEEKALKLSFSKYDLEISNKGMGVQNIRLSDYTDREKESVVLAPMNTIKSFELGLDNGKAIYFDLKQISETEVVGTAQTAGFKVQRKYVFNPENYSMEQTTHILAGNNQPIPNLKTYLVDVLKQEEGGSFFAPSIITQEIVVIHNGDNEEREMFNKEDAPFEDGDEFSKTNLVSIGSHYFATAHVDDSDVFPRFNSETNGGYIQAGLTYKVPAGKNELNLKSLSYFGPKKVDILTKVDPRLEKVVALGMFSALAKPLLSLLKWFNEIVGNYGIAIILLTLLVRMLVLPFNIMSYKSMAKMKKIQPQLQEIREKHKGDPVRSQQETYAIFKEHKVNPMGGCLPMLLQFPIFIALYQVLGQSIELYQAPFMFWIQDLSLKDPYYVLPVLMGITMFIQMKITPQTMDPNQAKVMSILPIFFTFIMLSLPSSLTLYIFISTLFGIIQQFIFMKEKSNVPAVAKV